MQPPWVQTFKNLFTTLKIPVTILGTENTKINEFLMNYSVNRNMKKYRAEPILKAADKKSYF